MVSILTVIRLDYHDPAGVAAEEGSADSNFVARNRPRSWRTEQMFVAVGVEVGGLGLKGNQTAAGLVKSGCFRQEKATMSPQFAIPSC